jgi:Siphovirus Gp157
MNHHADTARSALQDAVRKAYRPVWDAGAAYSNAYLQVGKASDIVDTMKHAVELILTAGHLSEMAAEAEKAARDILAAQMAEAGATTIQTDQHTAYLARKAAFVSVDQEDLVPSNYWRQPDPVIDRKAIKQAIEAGDAVSGCTIVRPNESTLCIKTRKA